MVNIYSAPCIEMTELNNLFIELTSKNCNQRCKHCYIDFPISKTIKDFISIDRVKAAIADTMTENVKCIFLTGAEPMTHPDFNAILRLCLKRASVCICTNASFINEKKARFLKKVEDEGQNEILFKLSIDHYNEVKNDDIRGRGTYRQTISALKNLVKYNFNPILNIVNYYNEDNKVLVQEFLAIFHRIGVDADESNLNITEYFNKYNQSANEDVDLELGDFDCKTGRVMSEKGVYVCPFLSNDHRGWMGVDFKNFSTKMHLETNYCLTCVKNKRKIFGTLYK